jgi:hypothetical protein
MSKIHEFECQHCDAVFMLNLSEASMTSDGVVAIPDEGDEPLIVECEDCGSDDIVLVTDQGA